MVQRKRKQHLDQLRSLSPYAVIGFFMLLCTFYSVITTFTPTPTGALSADCNCSGVKQCICVREIVKALTPFQLFCLFQARVSAYAVYPLYILMFLSVCHNLQAYLQHTIASEYIPLTTLHNMHSLAGTMIGVVVVWHTLWHLIRWGLQEDNLNLFLFHHVTGITGFISLAITPLLVWPMRLSVLRRKISFEVRKSLS